MKIRRLLIIMLCALAGGLTLRYGTKKLSSHGTISGHTVPLKEPLPAYARALRPNYPYSIIPGGAYSNAELQYADREDVVVKEHYADFQVKRAQMVQLTEDKYQYASYRKKNQVYWTKKKLRIPKGEILLTDGSSYARARCGNRLSEKPQAPVSNQEPPVNALLMPPMQLGIPMELAERPPLGELAAIPPVNIERLQPVLPTVSVIPPEMPPFYPVAPAVAVMPSIFTPGTPPSTPSTPPSTPSTPPSTPPVPPGIPPAIPPVIPPGTPPISTVPEPNAVYLFLVTFVLSLYGLTRLAPGREKPAGRGKDDGAA
jgi:hypothetical protein